MKRIALTLIAASLSGAAAADSLTAQQILEQFNLVTLGNVTSKSHVDGRSYIGGNLTGNGAVFAMHPENIAPSTYAGLTVAGSASGLQVTDYGAVVLGNLNNSGINGGLTYVGGNVSSSWINGSSNGNGAYVGGTTTNSNINASKLLLLSDSALLSTEVAAATSADFSFSSTLKPFSSSLSTLAGKSSWTINEANKIVTFTAVADTNKLAVFDLSSLSSSYYSGYTFLFDLGIAKTVIMNVAATGTLTFSSSFNDVSGYADLTRMASSVIWNFDGVRDLTTTNQFRGSILATSAHLTNNQNIEGVVMVDTLTQNAEIHATAFTGNVTAVPEPETYALMLGGLALMAGIARRRRAS